MIAGGVILPTAGHRAARYLRLSSGRGARCTLIAGGVFLPAAGHRAARFLRLSSGRGPRAPRSPEAGAATHCAADASFGPGPAAGAMTRARHVPSRVGRVRMRTQTRLDSACGPRRQGSVTLDGDHWRTGRGGSLTRILAGAARECKTRMGARDAGTTGSGWTPRDHDGPWPDARAGFRFLCGRAGIATVASA